MEKNIWAQNLGRMAKGKGKRISEEERQKRKQRAAYARTFIRKPK